MQHADEYKIVVEGRRESDRGTSMMVSVDGALGITDFYQVSKIMMNAFLNRPGETMSENIYILGLIAWLKDDKHENVIIDITEAKRQAERREASDD